VRALPWWILEVECAMSLWKLEHKKMQQSHIPLEHYPTKCPFRPRVNMPSTKHHPMIQCWPSAHQCGWMVTSIGSMFKKALRLNPWSWEIVFGFEGIQMKCHFCVWVWEMFNILKNNNPQVMFKYVWWWERNNTFSYI